MHFKCKHDEKIILSNISPLEYVFEGNCIHCSGGYYVCNLSPLVFSTGYLDSATILQHVWHFISNHIFPELY